VAADAEPRLSHATNQTSIDFLRSLLARSPDNASVRGDLAQSLLDAGDCDGAIAEASAALRREPVLLKPWLVRATARKARHDHAAAAADFAQAAALDPGRAAILVNLAHCLAELDRLDEAEAVLRQAVALAPEHAEALASLGSVLVRQSRFDKAATACRAALALDPVLVRAHQNLAGILADSHPDTARAHRDAAYRRQQIFIEQAWRPERRVLVLASADAGNVPLRHLMPSSRNTLIRWYIEYATEAPDASPPPFDLIFNSIGEADLAPALPPTVARLLREHAPRLINDPAKVALTGRAELPRHLAGIPGVVVPSVVRHTGGPDARLGALAPAGIAPPLLFRPLGAHGGQGVRRIDDEAMLALVPAGGCYLAQFVDFVSPDGWYRKYRMIFVDGQAFPYHLAIGRDWLLHYWTAGMEQDPARLAEERRFVEHPEAVLGEDLMAALPVIAARLGLDYAGIDFSLLPDGRMLVFEANATMLVHPEKDPRLAFRNSAVATIQSAFDAMLTRRAQAPAP
jgi:Tfp pilus assembly protein PilF